MPEIASARRWAGPVAILAVGLLSFGFYNVSPRPVAEVLFLPYALALLLGPMAAYAWQRRYGARPRSAAAAALWVPALWVVKECYGTFLVFGLWRTLYYVVNPLHVGLLTWAATQMAATELVFRRIRRGFWELTGAPARICLGFAVLGAAVVLVTRLYDSTAVFDAYMALYRRLFST
ncbi:MAG: hypothetical protein ACE5I7_06120 [Candidatus Binatia bacterium]